MSATAGRPTTGSASAPALVRLLQSPSLGLLLILVVALAVRLFRIADWSLWEDEETSIFFSQHPDKPFAALFPVFFELLNSVFRLTGVSATAGRVVATGFGLLSIGLTYALGCRLVSRRVGLVAALLVALNLGHLFWSQSVRYYTLILALQLLAMLWFWDGLERGSIRALVLANLALAVAMMTHVSAVFLVPVLVAYLVIAGPRPDLPGSTRLRCYLAFGLPLLAALIWPIQSYLTYRTMGSMAGPESGGRAGAVAVRLVAYFGAPVVLLGGAALLSRQSLGRGRLFLVLAALLPVAELVGVIWVRRILVTWYYIFFALPAFALLAAATLSDWWDRGWRRLAVGAGGAALAYSGAFLALYFTQMEGDRPRWKDAATYLADAGGVRPGAERNPEVYASVPGVVAYYLGVPAGETMGHPLVKPWPAEPPADEPASDRWFVIEARVVPPAHAAWLDRHCVLEASFAARTGPFDRSLVVYHQRATPRPAAPETRRPGRPE